jgi:hypothetical protein
LPIQTSKLSDPVLVKVILVSIRPQSGDLDLEIVGRESCSLGDASEHSRPDLYLIVESEDVIGLTGSGHTRRRR